MDLKKGIVSGIVYYAIIFLVASIIMQFTATTTILFDSLMWITTVVAIYLIVKNYYKPKSVKDAFMLSVLVAIIAFLIEIPVMVYGFAADQGWSYMMMWDLWIGYLLLLIVPALVVKFKL